MTRITAFDVGFFGFFTFPYNFFIQPGEDRKTARGPNTYRITQTITNTDTGETIPLKLVIKGSNLTYDGKGHPLGGTVTSIETSVGGDPAQRWTGFSLPFKQVYNVMRVPLGADTPAQFERDFATLFSIFGNIVFNGSEGQDSFIGSTGRDRAAGFGSSDFFFGMDNNDTLIGGTGDDVLRGGAGNDSIRGDEDADELRGGTGNDTLIGGDGQDTLDGSFGNDLLIASEEGDSIEGGTGNDTLTYARLAVPIRADGASGHFYFVEILGTTKDANSIERLIATEFNDTLIGGSSADMFLGQGGTDEIRGGAGNDTLFGGAGQDTIDGGGGNDSIRGGPDNDTITGGDGRDSIFGEDGDDTIEGGAGNDLLNGLDGSDVVEGNDGNDTIAASEGTDIFNGGAGADVYGAAVAERVNGDTISDFTPGEDRIDFSGIDADPDAADDQAFAFIGEDPFSGANGELRVQKVNNGLPITLVQGDLDGDKVVDFTVILFDDVTPTEADFIL
ncbi:hypothetical protein BH10PSE7_BH10PSE7_22730 [soil metagenome]